MKKYLEYKDEKSSKFWTIEVQDLTHTVTYGKLGTAGQQKTKTFETAEKTNQAAEKLIKAKLKKGYQVVSSSTEEDKEDVFTQKETSATTIVIKRSFLKIEEANERFNLDQYDPLCCPEYETVLLLEGDVVIEGDLDDNGVETAFFEGNGETEEALIIIQGNLTVNGKMKIYGETGYPCFLVLGDLYCATLFSYDNIVHVTGNAYIKHLYYGNYNHGSIRVEGITEVPYLINSDHDSGLHPSKKTILMNAYNNSDDFFDYDYYAEDFDKIFVKGLATEGELDLEAFVKRVKTGKSPFKTGVKPSRVLVENEIKKLAKKNKSGEELKELNLEEKKLQKLPKVLFEIGDLEVLNLAKNKLTVLPEEIGQLLNLRELDLRAINIKKLPDSIGQLKHLEILNLYNCRNLEQLPTTIGQLKNLKVLNLCYCTSLEGLPATIGALTGLKELILDNTKGIVPLSISKLTNLEQLSFTGIYGKETIPTDFPDWICELKGLKILHASGNKFRNLPETLLKLSKLEYLNLSYSLSVLEEVADLSTWQGLKELRVSGGAVSSPYASPEILQHFFKIKSLETLGITDFGEVQYPVALAAIEKRRAELQDNPEKLAELESRIIRIDGYHGIRKKKSLRTYKDDPEKLEEDRKRISINHSKYTYIARQNITKEAFRGLEQLINLKELDIRGIILDKAPKEIGQLQQLKRMRGYSNVFPEKDKEWLRSLGIEVTV
ncbi:MAG: leucine-rich repeat domain-containing protein [Aureispira sp.]